MSDNKNINQFYTEGLMDSFKGLGADKEQNYSAQTFIITSIESGLKDKKVEVNPYMDVKEIDMPNQNINKLSEYFFTNNLKRIKVYFNSMEAVFVWSNMWEIFQDVISNRYKYIDTLFSLTYGVGTTSIDRFHITAMEVLMKPTPESELRPAIVLRAVLKANREATTVLKDNIYEYFTLNMVFFTAEDNPKINITELRPIFDKIKSELDTNYPIKS